MRISHIEVERLLGYKNLKMDVDTTLQLIAGPNNAGKSSLIRLLETFFSDPTGDDLVALKPLNEYYALLGSRTLSSIQIWFSDLTESEKAALKPIVRKDGQMWLSIRSSRAGNLSYQASNKANAEDSQHFYKEVIQSFRFVKIPSVRVGASQEGNEPRALERLIDTLEAILVRSGSARSTTLQQDFASKISPVEALVRGVLDDSAAAIAAELPFREQTVSIHLPDSRHALRGMLESAVIKSTDDIEVPISDRGTGFQSALVLGILRYVSNRESAGSNLMFAIEEPEAFLHPQTQRAMAKILLDISQNAQLIITTHSPVLVDSFPIDRIARLPMQAGGTSHTWKRPILSAADTGRLSRYCSASNSELVFANAVILVEGEGDFVFVEKLLTRICGVPGGHYGLGITVIESGGINTMRYLVRLAELFGVRSYTLTDKDGLKKKSGKRNLIEMLAERAIKPSVLMLDAIRTEADVTVSTLANAVASQAKLNGLLKPFDSFTLSSDLEGLLLDEIGEGELAKMLGPSGEKMIASPEVVSFSAPGSGYDKLASWLGSKGWNCDRSVSGKVPPHLPAILIDEWLDKNAPSPALKALYTWLEDIVSTQQRVPV